ncbi:hypothetical protein I7I53_04165 [Histoplasma capsulatum var. duboisii H88]|uniref:Uncharacterized protein n=1 Tax=Ajellomyces capsulatus (strain H88) TaxID=544711 RepID=A0A8A1LQ63_AJEC8|nr:hypothetical protein I7I53_04165 [Histoplasma capsulatum var. duboisii H88]
MVWEMSAVNSIATPPRSLTNRLRISLLSLISLPDILQQPLGYLRPIRQAARHRLSELFMQWDNARPHRLRPVWSILRPISRLDHGHPAVQFQRTPLDLDADHKHQRQRDGSEGVESVPSPRHDVVHHAAHDV